MKNSRHTILSIVVFIIWCALACKKDYPDNVPDWVTDSVQACKEKIVNSNYNLHLFSSWYQYPCKKINEYYAENYGLIYGLSPSDTTTSGASSFYTDFYDRDGNYICTYPAYQYCSSCQCNFVPEFKRVIYEYDK